MNDTEPQTAGGKVLWHFTMSLDGFVARTDLRAHPPPRGRDARRRSHVPEL